MATILEMDALTSPRLPLPQHLTASSQAPAGRLAEVVVPPPDAFDTEPSPPPPRVVFFPHVGEPQPSFQPAGSPGVILMGGGPDVVGAFALSQQRLGARASDRQGDVVVLRASGTNAYDAFLHEGVPFSSVRTVLLPRDATPVELAEVALALKDAHGVFFAGGNQARYVAWKDSPLSQAVQAVHQRGGFVGGTSAGCAILGGISMDAKTSGPEMVTSAQALEDPFSERISFTSDMFSFLPHLLTDTHFRQRDRMGRLIAFVARASQEAGRPLVGVGMDEGTALVVDPQGNATLLRAPGSKGCAFVVTLEQVHDLRPGQPLQCTVKVHRLDNPSATFNLNTLEGAASRYRIDVDGRSPQPFSRPAYR